MMVDPTGPGPSPRAQEFSDPLSSTVEAWIRDFAKAAKGMRVYAENNEMLKKYLDTAHLGLEQLLTRMPELHLSIREDRILHNGDAVHVNSDREEGLPFTFYRNAFRRITLVRGMDRDELLRLLKAVTTDYKGYNAMGDDLVTTLWREALPHLRYLTIDSITSGKKGVATDLDREELDRIQGNIEGIVAAIYQTTADDDDIVAGVSITKEDLEALKDIRQESAEDLDMLDHATSRAIAKIGKRDLDAVHDALDADTRDHLTSEMLDILVRMLFKETSSKESGATIDLLQRLFDSLVLAQDYPHAIALIDRLKEVAEESDNMQEVHIARHLVRLFAAESRVLPVLNALNDGYTSASVTDMVAFLRALGAPIANALIGNLEMVTSPTHRRLLCDLIVEFGVPDVSRLMDVCESAKWFVVRDVLGLAQHHPPEKISVLIKQCLAHNHPKVRSYAVGMLRGYARGLADQLIVERIHDDDLDVRLSAIRVAAARRSAPARDALHQMLSADDLTDREPRELRMAMAAYAAIARGEAVPLLDQILNPGFLKTLKNTEPQVSAAFALASLGPLGAEVLAKGARSLNSKVRDACKRGLSRDGKKEADTTAIPKIPTSPTNPTGDLPDPSARTAIAGIPAAKTDPNQSTKDLEDPTPSQTLMSVDADALENAPPFYLYDPTLETESRPAPAHQPLYQEGPAVASVMQPYPTPDLIPENLPPAPRGRVEVGTASSPDQQIEEATRSYGDAPPPRMPAPRETNAPPSAAGTRDVMPSFPARAPAPPEDETWSPPSAAGTRDVMPSFPPSPPPLVAPPVPPTGHTPFPGLESESEAPGFDEDGESGDIPDWVSEAMASVPDFEAEEQEMTLQMQDLSDQSTEAPPPAAEAEAMALSIGELADRREEPVPAPRSQDDIPSADAVVASLFGDVADPQAEGETPLLADTVTGDISHSSSDLTEPPPTPSVAEHDEEADDALPDAMSSPYIPTVDSDPYGTPTGVPPPRANTWSGGPPPTPAPPPVLPWVDDLVLDSDTKSGGTEDD